jgi:hypothetical protein
MPEVIRLGQPLEVGSVVWWWERIAHARGVKMRSATVLLPRDKGCTYVARKDTGELWLFEHNVRGYYTTREEAEVAGLSGQITQLERDLEYLMEQTKAGQRQVKECRAAIKQLKKAQEQAKGANGEQ